MKELLTFLIVSIIVLAFAFGMWLLQLKVGLWILGVD